MNLIGEEQKALEDDVKPEAFAKDVLGFEEIQDEDEDGDMMQSEQLVYGDDETGAVLEDPNEYDDSPDRIGKSSQEING